MRDKVVRLASGHDIAIIEEVAYNGKKYVMGMEFDLEKEDFSEDGNLAIFEVRIVNDDIVADVVDDDSLIEKLADIFAEKIQNSEE